MVPLRVLVADDYPDTADTTAALVRDWGYQAETCYDGGQVVERCRHFRPHVVLLDLGLPTVNGLTLAAQLKAGIGETRMTLVAITGYAGEDFRQRCQGAGFAHFLAKPVAPAKLHELLDREFDQRLQN